MIKFADKFGESVKLPPVGWRAPRRGAPTDPKFGQMVLSSCRSKINFLKLISFIDRRVYMYFFVHMFSYFCFKKTCCRDSIKIF